MIDRQPSSTATWPVVWTLLIIGVASGCTIGVSCLITSLTNIVLRDIGVDTISWYTPIPLMILIPVVGLLFFFPAAILLIAAQAVSRNGRSGGSRNE